MSFPSWSYAYSCYLLGIWFRTTTSQVFNTARIPKPSCDTFSTPPSPSDPTSRTLLVSVHDWLYVIEVVDERLNVIPMRELECRLMGVVKDVARRIHEGQTPVPVSVLTTDHRDRWAEVGDPCRPNRSPCLNLSLTSIEPLSSIGIIPPKSRHIPRHQQLHLRSQSRSLYIHTPNDSSSSIQRSSSPRLVGRD